MRPLQEDSWVDIKKVTTATEAFDGDTIGGPLDSYQWEGDPYNSPSVHLRGGLAETVQSRQVRSIVVVDVLPEHNPDNAGILYISPEV